MNEHQQNKIPSAWFSRYLSRGLSYVQKSGKVLSLQQAEQGRFTWREVNTTPSRMPILVLSRSCYQEQWEQFPIQSERALKKILRNRPSEQLQLHFIGPFHQGHRRVLTIRIAASLNPLIAKAWWVVPESLLFARAASDETTMDVIHSPDGVYYLLPRPQGEWVSVRRSAVVRDAQIALLSMGGAVAAATREIDSATFPARLLAAVQSLTFNDVVAAWKPVQTEGGKSLPWLPMVSVLIALITVYALTSSWYLDAATKSRQAQLNTQSNELQHVLSVRQMLDREVELHHAIRASVPDQRESQFYWLLVIELEKAGARVQSLRGREQRVSIVADAQSATQVLVALQALPFVRQAEFSAPVRQSPQRAERFTLDIQLDGERFNAEE
ncbi:MAG: hypothetical protein LAT77_11260 [Aliidiomarina sp.]|uniref:hypothetical protein n=1 Tax=Aliidiomarina sp. TaxID=1872439 RepID=UPI0025C24AA2|nr:hypothetical protein [Aliidiomarina sp.]MCH8502474.1 hypothetical protein [Aliidiomarina sp.]